jgi:hypothetical protein
MARGSASDRARAAEEELYELKESRASSGAVAPELELRAVAEQQRRGVTALGRSLDRAAEVAKEHGLGPARNFLRTEARADIYMVGRLDHERRGENVKWYLKSVLADPATRERLLRTDHVGERVRADLHEYVIDEVFEPGLEALWKALGRKDREPLDL